MTGSTEPGAKEPTVSEVAKSMKQGPDGRAAFSSLGRDGVLRNFDTEYNVVDAKGLSPRQIKEFLDSGPYDAGAEKLYRGVDGRKVTSEEALLRPDPSILPKKPTPEERAARKREVQEHNRKARERGAVCVPGPRSNHDLGINEGHGGKA